MEKFPEQVWTNGQFVYNENSIYSISKDDNEIVMAVDRPECIKYVRADLFPEWKEIETAPKDGTKILLFFPRHGVFQGKWHSSQSKKYPGYWETTGHSYRNATHWMELPSGPSGTDNQLCKIYPDNQEEMEVRDGQP